MANPSAIFVDADALNQLFLGNIFRILRELRVQYGIQAFIVPEVEIEVVSSRAFGNRFHPALKKAVSNGILKILEEPRYSAILNSNSTLQASAVGISYSDIQALGSAYNRRIDAGEAYTFAAAVKLGQPAISNDYSALATMSRTGLAFPPNVLRAYDLLVFGHQIELFSEKQCDEFRQALLAESEFIPALQKSTSFLKGLATFVPRLVDSSRPRVGAGPAKLPLPFATPLVIEPLAP